MLSFLKEAAGLSPEKKEAEAPAEAAAPKDTEIPVARPIEAAATTPNAAAEPATEPATEAAAELAADTPLKPSSEAAPDASPDAVPEASPEAAAESSTSAASESTAQAATQATRELPAEISQLSPEADAEKLPKASEEAASESLPLAAIESTAQAAAPAPEVPAEVPQSAEALPEKLPEASADTAAEASPAAASESTATAAAQATSEAPAEVPPLPAEADPAKLPEASADAAAESSPSAAIESDAKESTPEVLAEIPQLPVEVDAEKSPEAVKTPDCSESVAQAEVDSKEPAPEVATEVVVDAVPEVSPEVVKEAAVEAVVEAEVVSDSVANTDFVEEFQRAPVEASKEAPPEFTACFPDEESKASAESPSKLAGVETLPPFVVESWSDAAPQPNSVDKGESWTASAEEARPELPHTFWQSALPSSTSPVFAFSDTRLVEQPASPAVSAGAPSLPVPPREGFLDKSPGASSGQGTPSPFLLLPPPPPPTSSVGSNSPLAAQVVKIEELKDQKAQEAAPAAKASGSPANAEAVAAAALALGHPTKGVALGMEPKVKAYSSREQPETDGKGASDEETAIVAGAADAEVDDDACELLLGTSENVDPALPSVRGPRGDGVDSDSEEEQEANRGPWHKSLPPGAAAPEPVDKAALEMPQGFSMEASRLILPPSTKASIETKGAEQRVKSWGEVDILVSRRLDKFFSNDSLWQQVADEIARTKQLQNMEWLQATPPAVHAKFRVQVPEPYPGIQYRRSKELSDRYPKYAKHGTTVPGILEDNGEWLKVGENVYLPTKVGAIEILKPVPGDAPAVAAPNPTPPLIESVAKFDDFKGAAPTAVTSLPDPEADGCTEAGRVDPRTHTVMRMTALRSPSDSLQEPLNTRPLSNLDEASRWLSGVDPNNPFTDTPRGGSPSESPLRSRLPSDQMAPINPFSDTPPGGSPSVSPLRSRPPASM
mmetsp:Transcript_17757/g.32675  ORF Transcript_17757/g.32675 Transcript_17757/m.32675 type:complete len:951 (-) Transcript_17757:39-2891(-)